MPAPPYPPHTHTLRPRVAEGTLSASEMDDLLESLLANRWVVRAAGDVFTLGPRAELDLQTTIRTHTKNRARRGLCVGFTLNNDLHARRRGGVALWRLRSDTWRCRRD